MDVADGDDGDAGHGDDQLAVFLDAADVAFGAFVDAVDHAHVVARAVLRRVGAEILYVPAGIGGGDQDKGSHLVVPDDAGFVGICFGVVHKVLVVVVFELHEPLFGAAHEHQGRDQLLLHVRELALVVLLHGVDGDIAFDSLGEKGFEVYHPVVEHFKGVPVDAVWGWGCKVGSHAEQISPTPRPS